MHSKKQKISPPLETALFLDFIYAPRGKWGEEVKLLNTFNFKITSLHIYTHAYLCTLLIILLQIIILYIIGANKCLLLLNDCRNRNFKCSRDSFFTNSPVNSVHFMHKHHNVHIEQLKRGLNLIVHNNYFTFNGKYYKQNHEVE